MKPRHFISFSFLVPLLDMAPAALASNTWYVDGVNGNDENHCQATQAPCKTIGHAISLASSGDSIIVASATYTENLAIGISLNVIGSGSNTTIIDGGGVNRVVEIFDTNAQVTLSNITIRNGFAYVFGGIDNRGKLTMNNTTVSGNRSFSGRGICPIAPAHGCGGGIGNTGTLRINNSTISGNTTACGTLSCFTAGGGIVNSGGIVTINNSTLSGNT